MFYYLYYNHIFSMANLLQKGKPNMYSKMNLFKSFNSILIIFFLQYDVHGNTLKITEVNSCLSNRVYNCLT